MIKTMLKKKKSKKAKWLSEEALQIAESKSNRKAEEKQRSKRQRRKGKIHLFEYRLPKNNKER